MQADASTLYSLTATAMLSTGQTYDLFDHTAINQRPLVVPLSAVVSGEVAPLECNLDAIAGISSSKGGNPHLMQEIQQNTIAAPLFAAFSR
jgi:hypothetical protein